jgi:hypothetical protein
LATIGIFGTVIEDGGTISDADAARAVVLECKVTEFRHGFMVIPCVVSAGQGEGQVDRIQLGG